jgi:uncharacterized Fe-S cluster-containing protein
MILPLFKIQHHRFRRPRRLLQQRQAGENHFVEVTDMVERSAAIEEAPDDVAIRLLLHRRNECPVRRVPQTRNNRLL